MRNIILIKINEIQNNWSDITFTICYFNFIIGRDQISFMFKIFKGYKILSNSKLFINIVKFAIIEFPFQTFPLFSQIICFIKYLTLHKNYY
jgi:hypothetical protein